MKVFISATSTDLRDCRNVVNNVLQSSDIQPVDQEHFPPDHRSLNEYLRGTVGECDAVICLVGHVFGAAPPGASDPPRSYTQLEYEYARSLGKPVFVFIASDRMCPAGHVEPAQAYALQLAHRRRLQDSHKWEVFDSAVELELRLAYTVPRIRSACGRVPMYYRHLPKTPAWFKGRIEECAQLREALSPPRPGQVPKGVIVVLGIGGQGKTTLVHHVLRQRVEISMQSGFWATAHRTGYTFDAFLDDALNHLTDGGFDKQQKPDAAARVTELLRLMQCQRTLIVIDGLEAWLRDGGAEADRTALRQARQSRMNELDDLLGQATGLSDGSHLIVTSRVWPAALDQTDVSTVPVRDMAEKSLGLDGLDPEAAVELVTSLGVRGTGSDLAALTRQFGYHPLALQVAAGYVVEEYGGMLGDVPALADVSPDAALQWLFGEVQSRLPAAEKSLQMLRVISLSQQEPAMPRDALDHVLQALAGSTVHSRPLLTTLARYQLLTFDGVRITAHPLVKQYFSASVDAEQTRRIHELYYEYYRNQPVPEHAASLDDVRPWLLALEHALLARSSELCSELFTSRFMQRYPFVEWFGAHGHFTEGAETLRRAAELDSSTCRYRFLIPRSALCLPMGRIDEAIKDLDAAIDLLASVESQPLAQPEQAGELAAALSNRGNAHLKVLRYDAAALDFERAVQLFEELAAKEDRHWFHVAAVRSNRGILFRELGGISRAIEEFSCAIDIYRTRIAAHLNLKNDALAAALYNRANAYSDIKRFTEALDDYVSARAIYESLLQSDRNEFVPARSQVVVLQATLLQRQSRHKEALPMLDQSVATLQGLVDGGKLHLEPTLAFARFCRARTLASLGATADALKESAWSRDTYHRLIGMGRTDLEGQAIHAMLVHWYCLVCADLWEKAAPCYLAVTLAARRLIQRGENDVRMVLITYTFVASREVVDRRPDKAIELFNNGMQIAEQAFCDWATGAEAIKSEIRLLLANREYIEKILDIPGVARDALERVELLAS